MNRRHRQRGAAIVEFAAASTAFVLMFFGIIEFSRVMYTYHAVANAARIGSRWAIVRGTASCSNAVGTLLATCPASSAEVQSFVQSQVPLADTKTLTVTADWPGGNAGCTSTTDHHAPGCVVNVTASNVFDFAVPFVDTHSFTISSTSSMVISQ